MKTPQLFKAFDQCPIKEQTRPDIAANVFVQFFASYGGQIRLSCPRLPDDHIDDYAMASLMALNPKAAGILLGSRENAAEFTRLVRLARDNYNVAIASRNNAVNNDLMNLRQRWSESF